MNTGKEAYLEIRNLKAKDIMKSPVVSMKKHDSVKDIAIQLISGPFSGIAITDEKERVIGIVTEYDILNQARKGKALENLKAEDVMQHNPVNVDVNTPLHDILEIMIEHGILRIPVTDSLRLVGNISRSDILKIIIEQ